MRSDLVFVASSHMQNRFMLCHWVRVASRRFHKTGEPIQETISKVLALLTDQQLGDLVEKPQAGSTAAAVGAGVLRPAAKNSASSARVHEEPIRNVG